MSLTSGRLNLTNGTVELSGSEHNYLHSENQFGLLLDAPFLNYRIHNNPYQAKYNTLSYYQQGQIKLSMTYSISENNVCYIIHFFISHDTKKDLLKRFIKSSLNIQEIKLSKVIRFWGFKHNEQNRMEVALLSACGFTFINKGISVVWKSLDEALSLKPEDFVLSRMASQGTD